MKLKIKYKNAQYPSIAYDTISPINRNNATTSISRFSVFFLLYFILSF